MMKSRRTHNFLVELPELSILLFRSSKDVFRHDCVFEPVGVLCNNDGGGGDVIVGKSKERSRSGDGRLQKGKYTM